MGEFETTTRKGRVVYNRPEHYFNTKDLKRVYLSVEKNLGPILNIKLSDLDNLWFIMDAILKNYFRGHTLQLEEVEDPETMRELESIIQRISIDLLVEIIEKIPFIPQKYEYMIAEFIYWHTFRYIDDLIYHKRREKNK